MRHSIPSRLLFSPLPWRPAESGVLREHAELRKCRVSVTGEERTTDRRVVKREPPTISLGTSCIVSCNPYYEMSLVAPITVKPSLRRRRHATIGRRGFPLYGARHKQYVLAAAVRLLGAKCEGCVEIDEVGVSVASVVAILLSLLS